MIRWATVTDVTDAGVWVVSAWLPGRTGPIPVSGAPSPGDPVLVARTDDGELAAVRGGDTRYLPLAGGVVTGPVRFGPSGALVISYPTAGWAELAASGNHIRLKSGTTELIVVYGNAATPGYVTTNRPTAAGHPANAMVTKGYVDAVKAALAASSSFTDFQTRVAAL